MKVSNGALLACRDAAQKLIEVKLPVVSSLQAAKFAIKLNEKLKAIDQVRQGLIQTHGVKGDNGGFEVVGPTDAKGRPASPTWETFAREFNELMAIEEEFVCEKIRVPQKITGVCDACKHNMDVALQIEPVVLMPLVQFIEVV